MHGIGKRGIEFGAKADQAGSVGCGQFEDTRESGRRLEQMGLIRGLSTDRVAAARGFHGSVIQAPAAKFPAS